MTREVPSQRYVDATCLGVLAVTAAWLAFVVHLIARLIRWII